MTYLRAKDLLMGDLWIRHVDERLVEERHMNERPMVKKPVDERPMDKRPGYEICIYGLIMRDL